MKLRTITLALALASSLCVPAFGDDLADGIAKIPGTVETVEIGGTWTRPGAAGQYRLVVSRTGGDSVTARLFVQWVAYQDDGSAAVTDSIEIPEFAELGVDIATMSPESDGKGLSVFIETRDPNGQNDATYELFVESPTDYRFGPASN
jgi:hypothetical protein